MHQSRLGGDDAPETAAVALFRILFHAQERSRLLRCNAATWAMAGFCFGKVSDS